jgi:hypothetical protein
VPDDIPNQLFVEWVDGDTTNAGDIHFLAGGETILPETWYHVAFTLTDTDAELWVAKETGPYELRDALSGQDFAGAQGEVLVIDPTPFTIGRGAYNNNITDWSDAIIDGHSQPPGQSWRPAYSVGGGPSSKSGRPGTRVYCVGQPELRPS